MNTTVLKILTTLLTLSPEILALAQVLLEAFGKLPQENQAAVSDAITSAVKKYIAA